MAKINEALGIEIYPFAFFIRLGFPGGSDGKESVCNAEDLDSVTGPGRSPAEGNDCLSCVLAWRIPWTEEPAGLHSMGSQSWTD